MSLAYFSSIGFFIDHPSMLFDDMKKHTATVNRQEQSQLREEDKNLLGSRSRVSILASWHQPRIYIQFNTYITVI